MRFFTTLSDPDRWQWFAAGDESVAPLARSTSTDNSPQRLLWEVGLVFAVPLALAALCSVLFGS
jgi:hypothetical protein